MSNNAEIVFAADAKGVIDEYKKMEKAEEQRTQKLLASLKVSRTAANDEKKLRAEVAAAIEKCRTPAEAYIATMNRFKLALQQGKMTAEEFNRVRDKELQKLNATKLATDKATTSVRALNVEKERGSGATSKYADGFALVATKALAAVAAVKMFLEQKKRMHDEAESTVATVDELSRDYAIQGGLKTEEERKTASKNIMAVARENASTPAQAFSTASQLASSGFEAPDGKSLDSALKIIQTSDMAKDNSGEYIDGAAKFLTASNLPLTGENLTEIGIAMRGLVDTPVQASDLASFAVANPALNMQGVDWRTGLGMMTELRKVFSGETVGTKMTNITQRLAMASNDKQAIQALKEVGLAPQDVDAIGESMPDALRTLGKAVYALPVEKQASVMGRIFNNENVAAADVLMRNIDAVDTNVAAMKDSSLFTAGVNFKLQGHNANKNRAEIDKQNAQLEEEEATSRRAIMLKEIDINRIERTRRQGLGKNVLDSIWTAKDEIMYGVGAVSDEELLQRSKTGFQVFNGWESDQQKQQAHQRLDKSVPVFTEQDLQGMRNGAAPIDLKETNQILKGISDKLTPPPKPTVNPNLQGRPK